MHKHLFANFSKVKLKYYLKEFRFFPFAWEAKYSVWLTGNVMQCHAVHLQCKSAKRKNGRKTIKNYFIHFNNKVKSVNGFREAHLFTTNQKNIHRSFLKIGMQQSKSTEI